MDTQPKKSYAGIIIGAIIIVIIIAFVLAKPDREKNSNKMVKDTSEGQMMKDDLMEDGLGMMEENSMTSGKDGTMMTDEMNVSGSYEPYNESLLVRAETGTVVLFFHAPWCPTCKSLDKDIRSHLSEIPENLTIIQTDYDSNTELKKKYGVTYQHTFVEVSADGSMIKKWSGSATLAALIKQI